MPPCMTACFSYMNSRVWVLQLGCWVVFLAWSLTLWSNSDILKRTHSIIKDWIIPRLNSQTNPRVSWTHALSVLSSALTPECAMTHAAPFTRIQRWHDATCSRVFPTTQTGVANNRDLCIILRGFKVSSNGIHILSPDTGHPAEYPSFTTNRKINQVFFFCFCMSLSNT